MKKINTLLVAGMLLVASAANAQKWNKDISFLKGQKDLNVQYSFDKMAVGNAGLEADYVSSKKAEYNKKEAGKGDKFETSWKAAPVNIYEPRFESLLNKVINEAGLTASQNLKSAKYTLMVHITFLEPGFNVGVMKKPAYCDYEFSLVETASPSTVLSSAILKNIPGSQFGGFDFDASARIAECYGKAGKMTGKSILKVIK
ncbi:MAG: hypothetical protein ABI388_02360 [Bacteroidia bacterium]